MLAFTISQNTIIQGHIIFFEILQFPHAAKYMKTQNENSSSINVEKLICLSHGARLAFLYQIHYQVEMANEYSLRNP
ncbi:hypothetical protein EYC80_004856 [Monilinia laxa]|uniref:Uncharacterized protein n=1 Tax=Monilinia laxa TaxID=61186 RepID=A0A5N6KI25_MONLA|nr:hypothetical protein EYC80_004856 [Monilinia laxa]